MKDKALKAKADEVYKSEIKNSKAVSITRIPQNKDWIHESPVGPAKKSDDQQYHYDRTLAYSNIAETMIDEIDDVRICRNEWITFVARNAYKGGLYEKGAEFDTLAMAISDYIENILLTGNFVNDDENEISEDSHGTSVELAYASRPDVLPYLKENTSQILNTNFLLNFYCQVAVGGASEEVIVTDKYIAFIPKKRSGWNAGQSTLIPIEMLASISVGSDFHTEYQGFTSYSETYWTLTFQTTNYQQFTRWLFLGRNEKESNSNRPILGATLDKLGNYFELEQGDSFETSGGYTTSVGYGFWMS
jgi:hypothetical protein